MPLSWNEIRSNAIEFAKEFSGETREHAEAKTFWDQFFQVFGLKRRHVASFEEPVKKISGKYGFIDLFWKKVLLAEHKSAGKDLGKATSQALDYVQSLIHEDRQDEVPRYIIVSDFVRIVLHDLEEDTSHDIPLAELYQNVDRFGFIPGYKQHNLAAQDPINLKAVQIMGDLHDALEAGGYSGHDLERLLVRVLFCLFAEDTGIFERNAFQMYLEDHTREDGSDVGLALIQLFHVLNTPTEDRQANLLEELATFPYVNGELFAERLGFPAFNRDMRNSLLATTRFDWSRISPAVFGALFQAVMEPVERRKIGAHYTSERDILKLIGPLFLDELRDSLETAGRDRNKLRKLHDRIASLKLFDPACGCGNFLVIAYRELRLIELEILKRMSGGQRAFDVGILARVDVDQMYGIEIEEWPARIAEVAMWLMDHQMNLRLSEEFGEYFVRLPLKKSPHIHHANALTTDWQALLPIDECSFILGNPPFVGAKYQTESQKGDLRHVTKGIRNAGLLDYVAGWYLKASEYVRATGISVAFVSTNSVTQGEQVSVLWKELFARGMRIHFAHRTFAWQSEARGMAHVHVVIIGFSAKAKRTKLLFDYERLKGDPTVVRVSNINPYLVNGPDLVIENRSRPICDVPAIGIGNKPVDGGNFLFTDEEKSEFVQQEPQAETFFRRWYGSREFINKSPRWCLWLGDCSPADLRQMPLALARVEAVREFRLKSSSGPTQKIAATPTRFHVENHPSENYLLIPKVSSERRNYVPMGYLTPSEMCSDLVFILPWQELFAFGVLSSTMHMAWMRTVAGRLKSDYRYSAKLVYNNFPWPKKVAENRRHLIEEAARHVLDVRDEFPDCSLADLYDPLSMPKALSDAHAAMDRAVDRCYRSHPFANERARVEFLFEEYRKLTSPLIVKHKRQKVGASA